MLDNSQNFSGERVGRAIYSTFIFALGVIFVILFISKIKDFYLTDWLSTQEWINAILLILSGFILIYSSVERFRKLFSRVESSQTDSKFNRATKITANIIFIGTIVIFSALLYSILNFIRTVSQWNL